MFSPESDRSLWKHYQQKYYSIRKFKLFHPWCFLNSVANRQTNIFQYHSFVSFLLSQPNDIILSEESQQKLEQIFHRIIAHPRCNTKLFHLINCWWVEFESKKKLPMSLGSMTPCIIDILTTAFLFCYTTSIDVIIYMIGQREWAWVCVEEAYDGLGEA